MQSQLDSPTNLAMPLALEIIQFTKLVRVFNLPGGTKQKQKQTQNTTKHHTTPQNSQNLKGEGWSWTDQAQFLPQFILGKPSSDPIFHVWRQCYDVGYDDQYLHAPRPSNPINLSMEKKKGGRKTHSNTQFMVFSAVRYSELSNAAIVL